jgi:cystathionine beta-synthase
MLNPGGSVKDRIGLPMIEAAERDGLLKPGGTIIEPTSGNTGHGLAIAATLKGYRCIFVMADKQSSEKQALLRAYGAEVVLCPTNVAPESPESYYSVAARLARDIPGAFKPDQYWNLENTLAHERTTGPEIWEQTEGRLDAVVISLGTGGTVSGVARYLKEQDPGVRIVGADPEGSIYSQPNDVHPYLVEGIGEDFYPETMDLSLIDDFVTVSDRDSFLTARRMAREEGILVGGSGGTAVHATLEFYDDTYMIEHGYVERDQPTPTVGELLAAKRGEGHRVPDLVVIEASHKIGEAVELMQRYGISQLPVARQAPAESIVDLVGALHERGLLDRVFTSPDALNDEVAQAMQPPLRVVDASETIDRVYADLTAGSPALVVADGGRPAGMLTRSDLLEYLAHHRGNGVR